MNRIVEKENRQMKEVLHRNISYDLLRIQAAILVVLLHVSAISWNMISPYKPQWMIINLYNSMTRGAVPIFFMLSGAFLLKKDIDIKDLYIKKIIPLSLVWLIWSFLYTLDTIGLNKIFTLNCVKSTHNRRECPVYGHRGGSRGRFYYRITTFEGRPWDARDPHKTTFMTLKHAIRLSIWRKQKETPGVEKAPGVSSPQRKESGRSGRDDGELRFGYDPAIHARRLRVYHRPRRLRMASRISIFFAARRFEPLNSMG